MKKRVRKNNNHRASESLKSHGRRTLLGVIDLPMDLTVEILKKLPVTSLMRFQCVSKQWLSTIRSGRDFIDSIVARSLTQMHQHDHFFMHQWSKDRVIFVSSSSSPHRIRKQKALVSRAVASTVVAFEESHDCVEFQYVRGLIGFWSSYSDQFTIHNPTTRQSFPLPKTLLPSTKSHLLGYDPFENQYKVLRLQKETESCQVYTLGDPTKQWRNIQCSIGIIQKSCRRAVCINGEVYFVAVMTGDESYVLVSFDVRSEKFKLVHLPTPLLEKNDSILINYQGKLGLIRCRHNNIEMWVMEDLDEKNIQEWPKIYSYMMIEEDFGERWRFLGVNHGGQIVFAKRSVESPKQLHVLYFDPKRNRKRYIDINITHPEIIAPNDGFLISTIPNHVENTMYLC